MKRKVYESQQERKRDERIGFGLFPLINLVLFGLTLTMFSPGYLGPSLDWARNGIRLAPWIVNGLFLLWSFIFRPHIGMGYLKCVAAILIGGLGLSAIFFASCIVAVVAATVLRELAVLIFLVLMGGGIIYFFKWAGPLLASWLSDTEG